MPHALTDLTGLSASAEDFLAAVLETAAQPIWVVDHDGVIRFANPAAIAALGYDGADELFGRDSHETIHSRHPDGTPYPAAECPLLLPRTTGETVRSDLDWFFRRDGSMFPVTYVSAPIELREGRGAVVAFADIEDRLRAERVLSEHDAVLAAREGALRRIAALVAGGAASPEVFAAIAREVAQVLHMALVVIWRNEPDRPATVVGAWGDRPHPFQAGTTWPVEERTIAALLPDIGRPARIEDFGEIGGVIPDAIAETGIRSGTGAAIVVEGELWGTMGAGVAESEPMPDHIEDRLSEFTELVATAISNSASREALARLADEQAALRRVATLVAQGVPPPEVFAAVAREVGLLLGVDVTHMARYELDGAATGVASWSVAGDHKPVGTRVSTAGENILGIVLRTGGPARVHDYEQASGPAAEVGRELGLRSSVGTPIVLDQRLWGVMIVSLKGDRPLPVDTESRIAAFTELVATAISNTEARKEVGRLADEQAALRRVATLVARELPPAQVFAAVAEEVGRLLRVEVATMFRYEGDGTATVVAGWGERDLLIPVGTRMSLEGENVSGLVLRTGRPARIDDYADVTGPIGTYVRDLGLRSAVGCPIVVEGRLWGAMVAGTRQAEPVPAGMESRIGEFTELVATAISNIQARSDLAASRARIVAATDDERRRVVRDLHDGAQQRLVHTVITLKMARRALQAEDGRRPCARDRGTRPGRARDRRAARARARHPADRPHARRADRRSGGARVSDAGAGRERRVRGPAPGRCRGGRVLRRRRDADQRRETRSRPTRRGHGARRGRSPPGPGARRRRRRCPARRQRSRRAGGPACRPRRPAPGREPARRRHADRGRHPGQRVMSPASERRVASRLASSRDRRRSRGPAPRRRDRRRRGRPRGTAR